MKRYLITITGRANLGYKGNRLRDRDLCYSYVYGKNKAEAISKFWEQIEKSSGLKGFERRDFKITAERWEKDSFLDVNGNVVTDIEWAIPFDLLASVEMVHDEHFKNYKLAVPESIMAQAEASEDADQAKAERIHDQILEKAQESNSEAQAEAIQNKKIINPEKKYHVISWRIGAPVDEKTDCGIWDGSGMAHFSEGFGGFTYSADGWLYFAQEAEDENTAQESKSEAQNASSAVRFIKISDYEFIARWNGEKIGRITISYKSYSPVIRVYRVNGNIDEKFETLDDAKMHLIQKFRAQAQEALDQIEDEKLMLRNKIDALDDQIADLFIKGAEMRTGKEAE